MVLNSAHRSVNYNVSVISDYNISQDIHMTDNGWHISDFGSDLFPLNAENDIMYINPRSKLPPYVVLFVLYEFWVKLNCLYLTPPPPPPPSCCMRVVWCVVFHCLSLTYSFPIFWNHSIFDLRVVSACCINVLYELCVLLERVVRIVSACCTTMFYACCILQRSEISWSMGKGNLKDNANQHIGEF